MTAVEVLDRSREALLRARQQRDVVNWLEDDGRGDLQLTQTARTLLAYMEDAARLCGERAMAELALLPPGREYGVLMRYYVLGDSLSRIAQAMGCDVRTATRAKSRGLKRLDNCAETEDKP